MAIISLSGNNWGKCENGISGLGCGPQETFRGCADIAIHRGYDIPSIKPNEIDVVDNPHKIYHLGDKNNDNRKPITNKKHFTYAYVVTNATREQHNNTNIKDNTNHSDFHSKPNLKNNDFLTTEKPKNFIKSKQPSYYGVANNIKHKTNNRYFYSVKNNNHSPFNENWDILLNSQKWPQSIGPINTKVSEQQSKAQNSKLYFEKQIRELQIPLITFNEGVSSFPEGFSHGGKRYNNFWLL